MAEVSQKRNAEQEPPRKITIILADDHPMMRQALRDSLKKQPDFEVIGEVGDGEEAVKLAVNLTPDVVIMDIGMPKLNGLEATRQIKITCPGIAVLILTVYDDSEHILSTLEAGAAGYLTKNAYDTDVIHAVRAIANGEIVISPRILQRILGNTLRSTAKSASASPGDQLSVRELQILRLAAKGMQNKEIALKLELSVRTVKSYLEGIFAKLRVSSRTEAIMLGLQKGFLKLEDLND